MLVRPCSLNNFITTPFCIYTCSLRIIGREQLSSDISVTTITTATPQCSKGDNRAEFGDFVSTEDEELDLEEIVEPWYNYNGKETSHVFYPICLGEVLIGRYLVEHKMGSGGGSTVWMAHDLHDKKDIALKVMASGEWADNEICMQNEIIQNVQDISHIVTYLAAFLLPGNGCHHRVLVYPLMGPCLNSLTLRNMPMATRMYAAR